MNPFGQFKAQVYRDPRDMLADIVRIVLYQQSGDRLTYLTSTGTWCTSTRQEEGAPVDNAGIAVPAEAIEALRDALERFMGAAGNPRVESAVLREWLTAERARVDAILHRAELTA